MIWLVTQFAMAVSMPAAAATVAKNGELRTLQQMLGVTEIVLCAPTGDQKGSGNGAPAAHTECHWCQAFSEFTLPSRPTACIRVSAVTSITTVGYATDVCTHSREPVCHAPRAPPRLI
ncbi:MAG: hypothetical protein AAGD13_02740 [Pseudomonadota bacterium]